MAKSKQLFFLPYNFYLLPKKFKTLPNRTIAPIKYQQTAIAYFLPLNKAIAPNQISTNSDRQFISS